MPAALPDVVGVLYVARIERAQHFPRHHLGKPDDCVEWGAQLMRHVGKEGAFRFTRRLGRAPRLGQPLLSFLDVAEVTDQQEEAAVSERAAADAQPSPICKLQFAFERKMRTGRSVRALVRHCRPNELCGLAERLSKAHAALQLRRE